MTTELKPGYHLSVIPKGVLGETSKIAEELAELEDAVLQEDRILMLVELADMYGAIEHFLKRQLPGLTMADLAKFSATTRRAFENGRR
jgi:hypothetical protein